jgi:hypothetical protein
MKGKERRRSRKRLRSEEVVEKEEKGVQRVASHDR